MKCPKCDYLGFETGDRCKNCGYDFSLMAAPDLDPIDIDLDLRTVVEPALPAPPGWLDQVDGDLHHPEFTLQVPEPVLEERIVRKTSRGREPTLPFVAPAFDDPDDEPLIKLPAAPRPPLAVRRTPDTPRLRVVPKAMRAIEPEPALAFDEVDTLEEPPEPAAPVARAASGVWAERPAVTDAGGDVSSPGVRLGAAAIDHLLLGAVDLAVVYFTLRIAGLSMSEWTLLPAMPLATFLMFVKLSYVSAFTAVGGQTIGKMALRIRVVTADRAPVDGPMAVRRAVAYAVSTLTLGLGFVPALFDEERRALHDRFARTRVIAVPSA